MSQVKFERDVPPDPSAPADYQPIKPEVVDWDRELPVVIKRPLIHIDFTKTAARTFGWFLTTSTIILAAEALVYFLIAGLASARGTIGEKTVTQPIVEEWGSALTFYPTAIFSLVALYIIIIVIWYKNR